jgi:hypothetical protein
MHFMEDMVVEAKCHDEVVQRFKGYIHGPYKGIRRHSTSPRLGVINGLARVRSSIVWAIGLLIIGLVGVTILLVAIFKPSLLTD